MATQTLIQLKYSVANSAPSTLDVAEPAYSFVSDKLYLGNTTNSPIAVGGLFYTKLLDANTPYAIPNTIVTRTAEGDSRFNDVHANTLNSNTTIFAGHAYGPPLLGAANPLIGATGDANNYVQAYIRNINAGSSASADWVATSDIGTDVSGWIDMGISSSTFNDENFTVTGPEEGYIFMSATNGGGMSGNLVIATDSTGTHNDIVFQTGGFTGALHPILSLRNNQGVVVEYDNASSGNTSGALMVKGGVGVQGSVYADALYDFNSRVVSTIVPSSGGGATFSASKSGNTYTLTVNNTGVHSLSANSGDTTISGSTGNLSFGLATTGVNAGTYGGATQVPSFTVDNKGRLTLAGNVAISTSFTLTGNTGTDAFNTGDTLFVRGNGTGIVTTVSDNTVSIATDTTVLRSNTSAVGPQTIQTDVTVTGNLTVRGTQIVANTVIVETEDSLIKLAANNTTDALDIGFFGQYNSTGIKYAGLFRKAADKFYLFKDVTTDPTSNTVTFTSANRATLDANLTGGTISGLASAIAIAEGGTNNTSFSTGQIIHFDGSKLASLANTGTAGTYGEVSRTLTITTDALGRVSSVSNNAIAIDASQISSGLVSIARGGTNNNTFNNGERVIFDGAKLASQANTTTTVTGGLSASNTITSLTLNSYGEITAYTGAAISIGASQITSGTLGVVNGGTGSSSFNVKGVVVSDNSSTTGALTALTGSAYEVLQLNSLGVPVFGGINGGTF